MTAQKKRADEIRDEQLKTYGDLLVARATKNATGNGETSLTGSSKSQRVQENEYTPTPKRRHKNDPVIDMTESVVAFQEKASEYEKLKENNNERRHSEIIQQQNRLADLKERMIQV